ncbi:MAG: 3-oxoacyl-[acyl-carrier-protein] reductase [Verrucomicrobiae bacterium]|nr:3-oxoacyl-[acyl-carrier-protein] reductase [Verrucomicrobiae bacterium]
MKLDLTGKITLVTGAGRGIGQAIALAFARAGSDVACVELNESFCEETVKKITELGRKALPYAANVGKSEEVNKAVDKALAEFGRIDNLVNNAGITRDGLLMRMSDEDWNAVLDTNLSGTFYFIRALSRSMAKQRSGCIVNIASIIGRIGNAGQANYSASKAGVIALTKTVAKEFASRNITCNAIAPGFIKTKMTDALKEDVRAKMLEHVPLSRLGTAEDVANAALFLSSPAASYITGQVLTVDGGMVM